MSDALASPHELCQDAADILIRIKKRLGSQFSELMGEGIVSDTEIFLAEACRFNSVVDFWANVTHGEIILPEKE